jgi:hypothetical protein
MSAWQQKESMMDTNNSTGSPLMGNTPAPSRHPEDHLLNEDPVPLSPALKKIVEAKKASRQG